MRTFIVCSAFKKLGGLLLAVIMTMVLAGSAFAGTAEVSVPDTDVYILYTSDVHCGIDQGFGYVGLQQVKDVLESQGNAVLLVDDGDYFQGETIGTLTKGEAIIQLMNDLEYDVAIPGNHDFDYGMDEFLKLTGEADFPIICCNFTKDGELVFDPYVIKEVAGLRIAFVGVTTPRTLTTSTPAYFQDENGNFIYGFLNDSTGDAVYQAVQKAVDDARAEGVDYVYLLAHLGIEDDCSPWTSSEVVAHTNGIDVVLDGHSHDTEQMVMKNKDGVDVPRSACGTKMECIGYSHISAKDGSIDTNIWSWPNKLAVPQLLGIQDSMTEPVESALQEVQEELSDVIGSASVDLTVNDPEAKDESGNPIRMVRNAETNLGDFCTDAFREILGSDIAILNGGAIRTSISKGDVTYGDILNVFPFENQMCVIEVTGQQLLDALEWGVKDEPEEFGSFFQVSGLSYQIDLSVPSGCSEDENGMMTGIQGDRRVKNVLIGEDPIDPDKTYTLGSIEYALLNNGDGNTAFDGCTVVNDMIMLDSQLLINYITENQNGSIGEGYENPRGQGRITILGDAGDAAQ